MRRRSFLTAFFASLFLCVVFPPIGQARLGGLDTSFGSNGTVLLAQSAFKAREVRAVAGDRGGRIIGFGSNSANFDFVRINATGSPDPSFGDGGYAAVRVGPFSGAVALGPGPAGAITAVGRADRRHSGYTTKIAVVRLRSNGRPDSGFGCGGGWSGEGDHHRPGDE